MITGWLSDIRQAFRMLFRGRRFTITAILTLALVVGTNGAIFTLCFGVMRKPIEVKALDDLVLVNLQGPNGKELLAPVGTFEDWKKQVRSLSGMSGYLVNLGYLAGADQSLPERTNGADVAPGFFDVLGGKVALGRTFTADEVQGKDANVVVLSHGLWKRRFAGAQDVIGKKVRISETTFRVVGVMSPDFAFPLQTDLWYPVLHGPGATRERNEGAMRVFGRLAPGVSLSAAEAELGAIHERLKQTYPDMEQKLQPKLVPLRDLDLVSYHNILETILAASYFLLIIGCANLATQLLARALGRRKEIATRISLGASPVRVIRQLLTESVVLSLIGSGLGVVVSFWLLNAAKYFFPYLEFIPGFRNAGLSFQALAYFAVVGVLTGALFGLAPALQLARTDLNEVLKDAGRGTTSSRKSRRLRDALIVAQVAMAVLVAFGAATFSALHQRVLRNKGFVSEGIVAASIRVSDERLPKLPALNEFTDEMIRKIRSVPGVRDVAVLYPEPYDSRTLSTSVILQGIDNTTGKRWTAQRRIMSGDVTGMLNIPLLRGRMLTESDGIGAIRAAVVSRSFVEQYFPKGIEPLGRHVRFGPADSDVRWSTIVGVIEDVEAQPGAGKQPTVYLSRKQWMSRRMTFLIRTQPDSNVLGGVRGLLASAGAGIYLRRLAPLDDLIKDKLTGYRFLSSLTGLFGLMALLIVAVGLNGATSHLVGERTNEIGLRAAIGASPGRLLNFVMKKGLVLSLLGLVVGLVAAVPTGRSLESLFYSFGALNPVVMAISALAVLLVAMLASLVPGIRACRLAPVDALRSE